MKASMLIAAGLLSVTAVASSAFADEAQNGAQYSNNGTLVQTQTVGDRQVPVDAMTARPSKNIASIKHGWTGSDAATNLPYSAVRGRPTYAQGEAQ